MIIRFQCKPMGRAWLDICRRKGWTKGKPFTTNSSPLPMSDYEKLKQRLLVVGQAVCLHHEPDLQAILSRGQFFRGYNARMMRGEPCKCHGNSTALWGANRNKVKIVTGYALTPDGMWRQHTWCVNGDNRVVETTERRLLYYGFVLTHTEAEQFFHAES